MRNSRFSISVRGSGVLHGPFITDGFNRWKNATMYDHGPVANAARGAEAKLGEDGYLNEEGRRAAKRIRENLKSPPKTDFTIEFEMKGRVQEVKITSKEGCTKRFRYNTNGMTFRQMDDAVMDLMRAVEAMMHGCGAPLVC